MQHIYRQSNQDFEVFTTVFSPQVCRSRTRRRQGGAEKLVVAVTQHRSRWPKELDLIPGDLVQVLFQEDGTWWFGRLPNGNEGYFPAACVEPAVCPTGSACVSEGGGSSKATPTPVRRESLPVSVRTSAAPCGCTSGLSSLKMINKDGNQQSVGRMERQDRDSPSLFHRVLNKSRRKSCPHLRPPTADPVD